MAEGCRERVSQYKVEDEGIPTNTTREQVYLHLNCSYTAYIRIMLVFTVGFAHIFVVYL